LIQVWPKQKHDILPEKQSKSKKGYDSNGRVFAQQVQILVSLKQRKKKEFMAFSLLP
jgi:hypothetical protein